MATNSGPRPITPSRLHWLRGEVAQWRADGLVDPAVADAIVSGYVETSRFSLVRLALGLGGTFAGIGLIWLVAANLENLSPLLRFALVALLWLGSLVVVGWLLRRTPPRVPLVESAAVVSALAFGALIMQAAQSLQVPAYRPALVGWWALGALGLAYAVKARGALIVGIITGVVWLAWTLGQHANGPLPVAVALLSVGALASAAAAVHGRFAPTQFAAPWRLAAGVTGLLGLFIASVPNSSEQGTWQTGAIVCAVVAVVAALAALFIAPARGLLRWEPLIPVAMLLAGSALAAWTSASDPADVSLNDWAHSAIAVVVFVAAATAYAVIATLRNSPPLMLVAVLSLAAFVTFQSFAVFARLIDGGWLFVLVGAVFVITGLLADRGRRELAENLSDERKDVTS